MASILIYKINLFLEGVLFVKAEPVSSSQLPLLLETVTAVRGLNHLWIVARSA